MFIHKNVSFLVNIGPYLMDNRISNTLLLILMEWMLILKERMSSGWYTAYSTYGT